MSKARVKIPKGTQCLNGVCEQDLELDLDIPEPPKAQITIPPVPQITIPETPNFVSPFHTHEEIKKDPHDELAKLMPEGVNVAKCKDGSCLKKMINPKQVKDFKSCPNCKFNGVPKSKDYCPTCGIDEKSKNFDEWQESDIEIEANDD